MKKEDMSCIDCAVKNCNKMDKTYPDFCLTTHMVCSLNAAENSE